MLPTQSSSGFTNLSTIQLPKIMPDSNYPPAYLRYLKARLSNFLRPGFWGTGFFLVAVGLVVRAYWLNPDIFTKQPNQKVKTEAVEKVNTEKTALSDEDKAIAADIDNMPTLLSDVAQATLLLPISDVENNTEENENTTIVEDIINQPSVPTNEAKSKFSLTTVNNVYPPSAKNPFVVQAQTLLKSDRSYTVNQFVDVNNLTTSPSKTEPTNAYSLNSSVTNQNPNHQNTTIVSPLETAIQQSSNINKISPLIGDRGVRQISPINSLPNQGLTSTSRMGYVQPMITNQQQNSYTNYNNVQTVQNVNIPATGVNPVNPVNSNSALVQPPISGAINSTTPEVYRNYGNNAVQQPSQLPPSNLYYPGQMQQGNNINQR
ncbi:hypothetical protein A0J48_025230 [Sphaerospermopsis aphanizomenoides BCCUSP55]|uniref:hypothetical protein n=1 Tax=Sphaerospermopsis aphanizomenoides TaxID=459663 RepID=UPI0019054548|nr:hypothetical protein [Sphaerospermopsis aphanizomenoides]MBK1990773.1 hypothetical protein [Sphaerospermopsis aphanizomenoides BCCUSP55]